MASSSLRYLALLSMAVSTLAQAPITTSLLLGQDTPLQSGIEASVVTVNPAGTILTFGCPTYLATGPQGASICEFFTKLTYTVNPTAIDAVLTTTFTFNSVFPDSNPPRTSELGTQPATITMVSCNVANPIVVPCTNANFNFRLGATTVATSTVVTTHTGSHPPIPVTITAGMEHISTAGAVVTNGAPSSPASTGAANHVGGALVGVAGAAVAVALVL